MIMKDEKDLFRGEDIIALAEVPVKREKGKQLGWLLAIVKKKKKKIKNINDFIFYRVVHHKKGIIKVKTEFADFYKWINMVEYKILDEDSYDKLIKICLLLSLKDKVKDDRYT